MQVLVAHPGQQHSYRLATALKKRGYLHRYVTTVYRKKWQPHMWLLELLLRKDLAQRARNRRNNALNDFDVVLVRQFGGLVTLLLSRVFGRKAITVRWDQWTSTLFQSDVAEMAARAGVDAVVTYGKHGVRCFEELKLRAPRILRVLDMPSASIDYMMHVYEEDMARAPEFAERLSREVSMLLGEDRVRFRDSLKNVDIFFVPSAFVRRSLEFSGVPREKISLVPYGSNFEPRAREWSSPSGPLRLLFVGSVAQMKGVKYLLEAVSSFDKAFVVCKLVGAFDNQDGIFDPYTDQFEFMGHVLPDEVRHACDSADVFIFPSLGEGMSLACLEAMSCGLPLICSENSGVNDIIENGVNGFVVPIGDVEALREKIEWFLSHRDRIADMGRSAQRTAAQYSWSAYEENVVQALERALRERGCQAQGAP